MARCDKVTGESVRCPSEAEAEARVYPSNGAPSWLACRVHKWTVHHGITGRPNHTDCTALWPNRSRAVKAICVVHDRIHADLEVR